MPNDVVHLPAFKEALQSLEEEVETWESFDGMEMPAPPPPMQPVNKNNAPSSVDVRQANGVASSGEDLRATGMAASSKGSSKKKVSKREKKKGGENLQEHGNGIQSEKMASI
jgi:hypothetical protein